VYFMSTACGRPQGGRGGQNLIFCGRHKWMTPKVITIIAYYEYSTELCVKLLFYVILIILIID